MKIEGVRRRLDASLEHHLLRIGLEAVTNAVKHSGATRIEIVVRFSPVATILVVSDDGCGVRHDGEMDGGHFGLQGMRERANKIGGVLELDCRGGTRLSVSVPTDRRHAGIIAVSRDTETVA